MKNKILTAHKMHEETIMSIKEICNALKISENTYYKQITLTGSKRNKKILLKENKLLKAHKMYKESKMSIKEVCNTLQISQSSYYRYMRKTSIN
jgi:predicted DNA-binding transcriptional regulator AlpA